MPTKLTVTVVDVNGNPISSATVKLVYTATSTAPKLTTKEGKAGEEWTLDLAFNQLDLTVSASGYEEERCLMINLGSKWQINNPACALRTSADRLDFTIKLGIIRLAPGISVPEQMKLTENPQAALIDPTGGPEWIYRGGYHNFEMINRLDEPIFGDLAEKEWKRFKHTLVGLDLARMGRLMLLEYGPRPIPGSRLPRFLVGTWVPSKPVSQIPEVVVFYSPPTYDNRGYPADAYPFLRNYPYAFTPFEPKKPKPAKEIGQPYISYAINYLISGYKIVYQLLAAGRNPIVIMPSQPSAQWSILDSQPGLGRLISEVLRFLFSRQLISSRSSPVVRLSLTNGRPTLFPPYGSYTDESMPTAFSVAVSGFSAGINAVVNVCTVDKFNDALYPADQKSSMNTYFYSPPPTLLTNWREIWDIDGVDARGWENMVKTFRTWIDADKRRALRVYHSDDTFRAPQNGFVDPGRLVRKSNTPTNTVYAEEGHSDDKRITWVRFSNSSLEGNIKAPDHTKTIPEFGSLDAHHFVPAIAFGHAGQFPIP